MNSGGWIRLHRCLADHPLWLRSRFTPGQAWVDLLLLASYADHVALQGNRPMPVRRGQVLTSQSKLAKRWGWDRETVRRFFRSLESLCMCHIETSKATDTGYTLVTLVNYDTYQSDPEGDPLPDPASDAPSVAPSDPASMPHPCPTIKKGKKGKKIADAQNASAGVASKGNGKATTPRKTHPETLAVLTAFQRAFEAKWQTAYVPTFGRDNRLLSELLTAGGPDEVRNRMRLFFANGTKRTRDLGDYGVPAFRSAWNELGVLKARGDL
jgi:hypothetical protein